MIIPVLLYHSIGGQSPLSDSWGAIPRSLFEEHLEVIAASGRRSLRITDLASALCEEGALLAQPVAVTFDDGYADTFEAIEALRQRGIGSTVYVTTGEIGREDRLTPAELMALAELPQVEVGAHGVGHFRLDELNDGALAYELEGSKRQLETLISQPVESFAYPHGAYDQRVRAAVRRAGYRSAAAVKNAISHAGDDPFAIARFTVTSATSAERLGEVLEGKGVPLAWPGERLRTRAYRIARRLAKAQTMRRSPA